VPYGTGTGFNGLQLFDGDTFMNKKILHIFLLLLCVFSSPAYAYIGPGLGAGALATILGVLLAIVMLVVGIVWYPLKRLIRSLKSKE
jgi:hypothetical protein